MNAMSSLNERTGPPGFTRQLPRPPPPVPEPRLRASPPVSPTQNALLGALPAEDYQRLLPHLELIRMEPGDIVFDAGCHLYHAVFPLEGIVSLLHVLQGGTSTEIALVGNEGVLGIYLFLGGESSPPRRAVVLQRGFSCRLKAEVLQREFDQCPAFRQLLLRSTQGLLTQIAQTAVCNRHHRIEQQLCRLLLLYLDRTASTEVYLTHEQIGNMLGVRREGVTEAAHHLQEAGLVAYRRGHVLVLNRAGLEHRACECYAVVKRETDRLLHIGDHPSGSAAVWQYS